MNITSFTRKSHYYNEDRFVVGQNYVLVLDGATSLQPSDKKPTSGSWLAKFIKNHLKRHETDIISSLHHISSLAYEEFEVTSRHSLDYLPSAGIALAVFQEEQIDLYYIGDCSLVVFTKDGDSHYFQQKALLGLDQQVIDRMVTISKEKGVSVLATRSEVNNLLIQNRQLANKPDGYSVFTTCKNPKFAFSHQVYKRRDVQSIFLFTDGFASAWDTFHLYPSYQKALSRPLATVIEAIRKEAYHDPQCNMYPRLKLIDDITAVSVDLCVKKERLLND